MAKPVLLTVDDDPQVLPAIGRDLRKKYSDTYRVLPASSGAEALDLLRRVQQRNEPIALLLVDHRMPQMTGIEFLAAATKLYPKAKTVLLTAYADTDAAIRAINEVKLDHYLMKPWSPPEQNLYPILDDLLEDWQAAFHPPFEGLRVLGTRWSAKSYEMREFLARNRVPYEWLDIEAADSNEEIRRALDSLDPGDVQFPVVLFPDGPPFPNAAPADIAQRAGLRTRPDTGSYDVTIIGGGPPDLRRRYTEHPRGCEP